MIVQSGALNTTALVVPDLYVTIVPPQTLYLNGVPTNVVGVVGTAIWGPVGQPAIVGSMADYVRAFGSLQNRKYDMGTAVALAVQQGAQNFRCVRVTDGTDTAATGTLGTTWLTFTAKYTGTKGNTLSAIWGTGSKANTSKLVIGFPGEQAEVYDNLAGTNNALAVAAAAAVNNGNGALRGPSQLVTAAAGVGTTAPTVGAAATFTTGTDGTATITAAVLVGVDTAVRKGMYALRGQGCSIGVLADADDSTQWTVQDAFGLAEGLYMILCGPAGDTIANAVSTKATAGLDSYACKLLHGDWLYWNDQVNAVLRLVSPQGFAAGRLANLSPEQSSLNKPLYGVVGSQKSGAPGAGQVTTYSDAELGVLMQAGIDVICNPGAGGQKYWTVRGGHNSSSNAAVSGDNYTRMTNYIAATLNAGMGIYIGKTITNDMFDDIRATQMSFFANMMGQHMLAEEVPGELPYGVKCDLDNNPRSRTSLGYVQSDAQVTYLAINEKFIVNIEGGTTVTVNRQRTPQ